MRKKHGVGETEPIAQWKNWKTATDKLQHSCRGRVVKATDSKSVGPCQHTAADNADITFAISYGYSEMCDFNYFIYALSTVVVAEWLRRQTRNLLGPASVGSNPVDNADIAFAISYGYSEMWYFNYFIYVLSTVVVAEWLRRQTRNLLGPASVGSNPADNAEVTFAISYGYSEMWYFNYFIYVLSTVVVAEWLRRQTRNLLGPASVGSNPADNADVTFAISYGYSEMFHFNYFIYALSTVVVAEWLRRQTRNLLGPARVGSNPADNADITFAISYGYSEMCDFNYFIYALSTVVVAEWLRRQTRNLLGPARAGSNPADNADITLAISHGYSEMCHFNYFIYALSTVVVAEWLRRQTRNLLGPASVGSSPADNADITFTISYGYSEMWYFNYFIYAFSTVVVAEWLRRQTRNLLRSARLGSNPADNAELESRFHNTVVVAEWLRRQTRNLLGPASVGSNPADNADVTFAISYGYSEMWYFNYFIYVLSTVVVAEWLRRQTRNLLGPASVGSNPADNADVTFAISYGYSEMWYFNYFIYVLSTVVVAEWLRRQTRNLLGPASVGSNPADNADVTFAISYGYSEMFHFNYFIYALSTVVVAEWLRRQTRNLLGPARVGSSPADNADISFTISYGYSEMWYFNYFIYALSTVVVAEWLRRQTRNLLGSARLGSNPADNADITLAISHGYSEMFHFNYFIYALSTVVVAEWLRRQTRNLLGPARVGSNPADNADITFAISYGYSEMFHFNCFIYALSTVVVAEWLRRQTRNLLGPARVGSNPADNADITLAISHGYSEMFHFNYFIYALSTVVVAEWLRRQTRNLLGPARVGSNPADNADFTFAISYGYSEMFHFNYFIYALSTVFVAEWLRRQTRNLLGPARVGSSPADNADITFTISYGYSEMWYFNYFIYAFSTVVVAEWLRRQTRNLLRSARLGSNTADNAELESRFHKLFAKSVILSICMEILKQ
ncbi:unnamed protein product [Clavelina lepadiformis]|uniref:G protein-coupled receptor n=1 Tax=Clavelina lepadiformis TaxID=159417 RepID=A0ABP0F1Z2_CLALP